MAERFQDVYELNLQGNYAEELNRLQTSLASAKAGFDSLSDAVKTSGARFAATKKDYKASRDLVREFGEEALDTSLAVGPVQEQLAISADVLAQAYNQLVKESSKLAVARAREGEALDRLRRKTDPQIIAARAETRAAIALNKGLEDLAFKREFANKAAKEGLQVSADGKSLFDAERIAAERAGKAVQGLAVAEALRKRGLDIQGNQLPAAKAPTVDSTGALTAAGKAAAEQNAQKKAAAALLKAEELQVLKNNKAYLESVKASNLAQKEISALTKVGEETQSTFNRVSFTFRRLIGIMAAFTIARQVTSGFVNIIKTAIEFNAAIETGRVGLAGLIAASAEIRDPLGGKLGIDEQVLRSQDIAIDQMKKLRFEALNTAASYDELSRAFNSAVAPGIQAGLTLDQIRKVTVNISQAATGLGLAQDQLAEEIRSLFQGTITARSTRIATALGISNADIENAKRLGTLFDFLSNRFAAIGKTGKLLLDTFTGQLSNAADAFKQLLATASGPLFEQLKAGLKDLQNTIFETTSAADVIFKPGALKAFEGLFEGLANGVKGIRDAFKGIDATSFGDAFAALGQALGAITSALANGFVFFVNAASPTVTILAGALDLFTKISIIIKSATGFLGDFAGKTLLTLARLLIMAKTFEILKGGSSALAKLFLKIAGAAKGAAIATTGAEVAVIGLRSALNLAWLAAKRFLIPLLVASAIISGIDAGLKAIGIDFSLSDLIGKGFDLASSALDSMLGSVTGIKEELATPSDNKLGLVNEDFRKMKASIEEARKSIASLKLDIADADLVATALRGRGDSTAARQKANVIEEIRKAFNSDSVKDIEKKVADMSAEVRILERELSKVDKIGLRLEADKQSQEIDKARKALTDFNETHKNAAQIDRDSVKATKEFLGVFFTKANEEAFLESKRAERIQQRKVLQKAINDAQDKQAAVTEKLDTLEGKILAKNETLADLKKGLNDIETAARNAAEDKNATIARDSILSSQLRISAASAELDLTKQSFSAFVELDSLRGEAVNKELDLSKIKTESALKELNYLKDIADLTTQLAFAQQNSAGANAENVTAFEQQLKLRRQEIDAERALTELRIKRAAAEAKLAELREKGSVNQGIGFGLQNFAQDNASVFNTGEQFGKELGNAVPQFVGSALKTTVAAAFDKTQNVDLGAALADLGAGIALDLAANLIQNLVANLLSSLLTSIGVGVTEQLTAAGEAALTLEAGGNSAGLAISANSEIGANIMFDGISLAGGALIADATTAAGIISGTSTASTVAGAATIATATGGAVNKARRFNSPNLNLSHARATGYAAGGRPLGIDPRDTIPAWLRPGEWVIRPEAVRLYGDRIFDLLNRGALNPSALHGVAGAAKGPRSPVSRKVGFATGGQAVHQSGGNGRSQQVGLGQVIQFHDEQTMERALAAGPNAPVRFARARRSAYRAALGLEPGT